MCVCIRWMGCEHAFCCACVEYHSNALRLPHEEPHAGTCANEVHACSYAKRTHRHTHTYAWSWESRPQWVCERMFGPKCKSNVPQTRTADTHNVVSNLIVYGRRLWRFDYMLALQRLCDVRMHRHTCMRYLHGNLRPADRAIAKQLTKALCSFHWYCV